MSSRTALIAKNSMHPLRARRRNLRRGARPDSVLRRGGTIGEVARVVSWISRAGCGAVKKARFAAAWGCGEEWTARRIALVETARRVVDAPERVTRGTFLRYCQTMRDRIV
ncbi:hypothetical protein [Azospirillum sp. B510]|uniref:hypothetical protein n=1 Tax=Azospirillum sp. (strain B510) TaxID=137722 RepID=UPI0005A801D2|nr:hypothetical protein [Azospirillum sp. B510]